MTCGYRSLNSVLVALALLAGGSGVVEASEIPDVPRPMDPVTFIEMPFLESPVLSPDGKRLLVIRSEVDWKSNKRIDRYQIVSPQSLTVHNIDDWGLDGQSLSSGIWAPDGSGFISLLKRDKDKKKAAYFFDVNESKLTKIFEHVEDIRDVDWGENGTTLYYRTRRHDPRTKRMKSLEISEYDVSAPYELWKYDLANEERTSLVAGDFSVSGYHLPDKNSAILYSREPQNPRLDSHHRELWLYDMVAGKNERLTANAYRESNAKLSPDGSQFAFIATVNEQGEGYYEDNLFIQKRGETKPRLLLPDEPMEVLDFEWDAHNRSIFILGNIGVRTELFQLDLQSEKLVRLTDGDHEITNWQYDRKTGRHIALIKDGKSPGEVYLKQDSDAPFTKITSEYDAWAETFALPEQSLFKWTARDGQPLEGIIARPFGYKEGQQYPLVTITHGGPRTSSQFGGWNRSRYLPVLTGMGYAVFLPNHRGGTGYGDAFLRDMVGNYFNNAHLDILDGIDSLIASGIADPDRLIKMGWSAGGHMTNKMVTFTDRFKAASSGAGASEWMSLYAESDVRHNRTPWFGGAPWQKDAPIGNYVAQSTMKDAWRVTTPTLFFNGAEDVRVPPTQAIMMYRGIRATGTPTRLYLAPGEPHGYRKPTHQLFKINTELEWFARHALEKDYTPVLPATGPKTIADETIEEEGQ